MLEGSGIGTGKGELNDGLENERREHGFEELFRLLHLVALSNDSCKDLEDLLRQVVVITIHF